MHARMRTEVLEMQNDRSEMIRNTISWILSTMHYYIITVVYAALAHTLYPCVAGASGAVRRADDPIELCRL